MDVLIANKPFREQLKKCIIEIGRVDKEVKQLSNSDRYEVAVYGYDKDDNRLNCCTLHVNTKNRTVNLIK